MSASVDMMTIVLDNLIILIQNSEFTILSVYYDILTSDIRNSYMKQEKTYRTKPNPGIS